MEIEHKDVAQPSKPAVLTDTLIINSSSNLSVEAVEKILIEWNETSSAFEQKAIQLIFEEQVAINPNNTALIYEDSSLTYRQLNEKANQLAHYLRETGVKPDTLVAISLEPSLEMLIGIIAILKAGGAYVPLDPKYPADRLQFMLEDTNARVLITESSLQERFTNKNVTMICMDSDSNELAGYSKSNPPNITAPENMAYVIYTSGSTGKPKGVMITHGNVCHFTHWFSKALSITNKDIVDFSSSISFDFSVATTLIPLVTGAAVAICPEASRQDHYLYLDHIINNRVSIIKITPSHFRQLKEYIADEHKLPDLQYIIFGGESAYANDIKDWLKLFPHHKILNEYGPTEASVATTWTIIDKHNVQQFKHILPIGKAALNSTIYILDEQLMPVPIGEIGELYIGGTGIAKGYLNRPDVTEKKFILNPFNIDPNDRLYKSGDICRYLPDGNIEFIERVDHQVKIRGFRIETGEIENCLASHPDIKSVVVVARDDHVDQTGEKRLVAYLIPKDLKNAPDTYELQKFAQERLPEYMVPAFFMVIEKFPLSPNGKLDRKSLPHPQLHHIKLLKPRTELEELVAKTWADVLNINEISIDDNFFELGGHSLSAARIISKIGKLTNKHIKLDDFYHAPTIAALATLISHIEESHVNIATVQPSIAMNAKILPLSDMQLLVWFAQKSFSKSQNLNVVDRKRISGKLDTSALYAAFICTFKKHPILRYKVSNYIPIQYPQEQINFKIDEYDIQHLSAHEQDDKLAESLNELKKIRFRTNSPSLLIARLYKLKHDETELQICMSHLISDEVSAQILFQDLSNFYLQSAEDLELYNAIDNGVYKNYIIREKSRLHATLNRDVIFWEEELKDTSLFSFPLSDIVNENKKPLEPRSTYYELPSKTLEHLKKICAQNKLSMSYCLNAAVALALEPYIECAGDNTNKHVALNFIRSTRDSDVYDDQIGFFIRTDLIKLNLSDRPNLLELARRVQKSAADTAPYQHCPSIAKLAYFYKRHWKNKKISNAVIKALAYTFNKFFRQTSIHPVILAMYGRMYVGRTKQNFLVQVNIFNNFIQQTSSKQSNLFGLKIKKITHEHKDRTVAKNVLDVCFMRNEENKAYLIISGNLKKSLREQIAHDIVNVIARKPGKS